MTVTRQCLERGCAARIPLDRWGRGPSYCDEHRPLTRRHQSYGHQKARAQALATAESRCQVCGTPKRLHLHHVDGDPANNAPENLLILCRDCHTEAHRALREERQT